MEDRLLEFLSSYGYVFLFALTFLECGAFVGLFVPGESVLILSAALASQGRLDPWAVFAIAWGGAFAGDLLGYSLGRRYGRRVIVGLAGRFGYHAGHFDRTETFFGHYGALAIIAGRFVGVFRSLLPATAGTIGYPRRNFVAADAIGSALWAGTFTIVGMVAGEAWTNYQPYFVAAGFVVMAGVLLSSLRQGAAHKNKEPASKAGSDSDS